MSSGLQEEMYVSKAISLTLLTFRGFIPCRVVKSYLAEVPPAVRLGRSFRVDVATPMGSTEWATIFRNFR